MSVLMQSYDYWWTRGTIPYIWAEVSKWVSVCYHMSDGVHEVSPLTYEQRSVHKCLYVITWLWTWGITPNICAENHEWVSVCNHISNGGQGTIPCIWAEIGEWVSECNPKSNDGNEVSSSNILEEVKEWVYVCDHMWNGGHEVSSQTYEQRSLNECLNAVTWLMVDMRYHP